MKVKVGLGLGLVVSLAGLAGASMGGAATQTGIRLDSRIGPVRLGEPRSRVTTALGRGIPVRLHHLRFRLYPSRGIYVLYPPNPPKGQVQRVALIMTRSAMYKTVTDVGVGSSQAQLRHGVKVRCFPQNPIQCQHGYAPPSGPGTSFLVDVTTHRVIEIDITYGH